MDITYNKYVQNCLFPVSFLDISVITSLFIFDIAGKKWENIGVKSGRWCTVYFLN